MHDKNFDDDYKDTEGHLDMNDRSLVEVPRVKLFIERVTYCG